ncbi:MAG: hypothetical protein M3Y91_03785 [Actinomycetota bacterium]|nr:hypothetical protein [Actinomycetota bacterium]
MARRGAVGALVVMAALAGCASGASSTAPARAPASAPSTSVPAMTLPGAVTAPGLNGPAPADSTCAAGALAAAARARGLTGTIMAHTCVGDYALASATVSGAASAIGFERNGGGWRVVGEGLGNDLPASSTVPSEVSAALSSNLAKAPRTDQAGF